MNKGGDGGNIFIAARKIQGGGKILADGGQGDIGGKGGNVSIISEDMSGFDGEISAKGGDSVISEEEYNKVLNDLKEAIQKKDKGSITKILLYVGDKSVDLLIALLTGKALKDLGL